MTTLNDALAYLVARRAFAVRIAADGQRRYRRCCSGSQLQALLAELQCGLADNGLGAVDMDY